MASKKTKKATAPVESKRVCKTDLIKELAKSREVSIAEAGRFLNDTLSIIEGKLNKGNNVSIMGFGTFSVKQRAARTGRNPQTGKSMKIKACKVIRFKVGSNLAKAVK